MSKCQYKMTGIYRKGMLDLNKYLFDKQEIVVTFFKGHCTALQYSTL